MSFFSFCEILLVGNSNILNSWTICWTKNWLDWNGILNLAQAVNRLFINRELCGCFNFVRSPEGGEMPAWHSCSHSQDLKAVGVAQNIPKIHLYKIKTWNSSSLTLVLGMKIDCILWKAKKILPKPPCGASTWTSAAFQGVAEGLCCHIFGQQDLCPCWQQTQGFNKVKTCPSDKRLIRANGSGFNAKSLRICLGVWLCLKILHSRRAATSLLEWTQRCDTSRLLILTFPPSSAEHQGSVSQRKLMRELAVVEGLKSRNSVQTQFSRS